jgi:hypothetical protein
MASTNSKPKRTPRRAAKDKYEEETLMTSDKSQLIDLDLVVSLYNSGFRRRYIANHHQTNI